MSSEKAICIALDLDGVLLDFKERFYRTYHDVLKGLGFSLPGKEEIWGMRRQGLSQSDILERILPDSRDKPLLMRKIIRERKRIIESNAYLCPKHDRNCSPVPPLLRTL